MWGSSDIYSKEYICTHVEMLDTTISIIAVKLSYKKTHLICKRFEKIQSKQTTLIEFSEIIISLRIFNDKKESINILKIVNLKRSVFLKKKLKKIKFKKFNKGKNIINKYIKKKRSSSIWT